MPQIRFHAPGYNLAATLDSGQAFRWTFTDGSWSGVVGPYPVQLRQSGPHITAHTPAAVRSWRWLAHYLQVHIRLPPILASFPPDPALAAATAACPGLRLLRQDPWECLASFILSSTKQILHIRQMVERLARRYGQALPCANPITFAFPTPDAVASASDADLRACGMGFRAPYLLATARRIVRHEVDLGSLRRLPTATARVELMHCPGVGRKIADCVLLFAYGRQDVFPVDTWTGRALRRFYFHDTRVPLSRLQQFAGSHFGPYAGYAQQYLFHYARTAARRALQASDPTPIRSLAQSLPDSLPESLTH